MNAKALATALVLCAALTPAVQAAPLLFHDHGHGLTFSTDGRTLLAPGERGLAAYEDGTWWEAAGPAQGFSGFSVAERAIYASGHAQPGRPPGEPAGLLRSVDGGRTWQPLALAGVADFRLVAAGYRSGAIYVLNGAPNREMKQAGIFVTRDEGKTWRAAPARGLAGPIHGLAAHPLDAEIVAAGTDRGLHVSRDGGASFRRLDGSEPVTALTFDHLGARLLYARALSNDLVERRVDGSGRRRLRLPHLAGDYVTCLAHSPTDENTIAFATRKRDAYLTRDGGGTWRRLAASGVTDLEDKEAAK